MFGRKILVIVLLAAGTLGAMSMPTVSEASSSVSLRIGPPPVRYEIVPDPRRGYVWVPGYWRWRGHHHVWVVGCWVRERRGYVYYPHRWEQRGERWYLHGGRWDRDGDGIPDRRKRHPNNPYRP